VKAHVEGLERVLVVRGDGDRVDGALQEREIVVAGVERGQRAISMASSTIVVRMCEATRQPTIMRLNASVRKHT
jgi:hypothetical protein